MSTWSVAMSLFEYLKQKRSPKQKLIDAIRNNDVREVHDLLESGLDPETQIHEYGEDTVVHQAASRGHFRCLEELIKAGANCDVPNAFGITPIFNASRRGHARAMQIILTHSTQVLGLLTLWYDGKWTEFLHSSASDDALSILIIATPDVNKTRENLCSNILFRCIQKNYVKSLYAFFLSGYKSNIDTYRAKIKSSINNMQEAMANREVLVSNMAEDKMAACLAWFQKVDDLLNRKEAPLLQHICRICIRNSFYGNCNVYYGAEHLRIPTALKKYLVLEGDMQNNQLAKIGR